MLTRMRVSVKCFMWQEKKGGTGTSAEYVIQNIYRFLAH
ncbi:plasmid replication initiation protein [Salmonella enterica subsp. enterica serovar Braenderup]|uniref:Plasmid replication initiation protein n=1 Tax=Salmonella enterica subsp. enterica serovar Braenderup TaxID=149391 RepID=A0A5I0H0X4_SALET|nr:plasmid replication initiation protein [Salmonella enterica subsp. enterica serovar Braenderup]EAO3937779.1 plasmid replication initiation protein [Salmonella enterica]EDR0431459.1 plasmid replication initiation protein [Salmonella enterica subsp. enterica]THA99869.1 plasmid replication initiation protein [Citrobacter freundii]EAA6018817.1 plasmid replication initiation protein [Salmonella enterica subsp. enterica serovar Braenderup]